MFLETFNNESKYGYELITCLLPYPEIIRRLYDKISIHSTGHDLS